MNHEDASRMDAVSLMQHNGKQSVSDGTGNPWMDYFGPPKGPIHTNAYDKFQYTNFDLPKAYEGSNLFLRDTIDGFIMEDNTWYTSVCLPYVRTDEHHFAWNEWHFDTHVVGKVPEEGVSRLLRSSQRSFKESTVRRGIAFTLEHGFMNTPMGREQYVMNLKQIKQSVQETANHDVLAALLTCRRYDHEWERKHGQFQKSFKQITKREVTNWGIVQKHTNGLDIMHEEFKQRLKRWSTTPDMWIFPPRLCLYLAMVDPKRTEYRTAGPGGVAMLKAGPAALTQFRGVNVYETRMFDVYEGDPPIDLLRREQVIGEFNVMKDPFAKLGDAKYSAHAQRNEAPCYSTNSRDIKVYNEETDNWSRVSFKDALKAVDREGLTTSEGADAEYFWQLGDEFFSQETLHRVGVTMVRATQAPPLAVHTSIRARLSGMGLGESLYLSHSESKAADAVPMFQLRRASDAGVDASGVEHTLKSIGMSVNLVKDVVSRLEDAGDKQRFLSGLQAFLVAQPAKAAKNVLSGLAKRLPKGNAKLAEYLESTPCWNADADVRNLPSADTWVKTSDVWSPGAFDGRDDMRPGDPKTNYETPAPVGFQPTGGWASEPWVGGLGRAARAAPARAGRSKASRRVDASDLDDLLGSGAEAAYIGANYTQDERWGADKHKSGAAAPAAMFWPKTNTDVDKCIKTFLTMKITPENLVLLANNNVLVPFNVVLARNHMSYDMCSAILMKSGSDTGITAVGHNDFQLGDDVGVKMHYGNYTFKSKSFVQQPRNVIIAENIFAQGYNGGNGVSFCTRAKPDGDVHAILCSYEQQEYASPLSLSGHFAGEEQKQPHIEGSRNFIDSGGWVSKQDLSSGPEEATEFLERRFDTNTICYQGHQFSCDTATGKLSVVTRNTGHWGQNVYPGCAAVRAGENQFFEKQAY